MTRGDGDVAPIDPVAGGSHLDLEVDTESSPSGKKTSASPDRRGAS
jgi:hypothetical protein